MDYVGLAIAALDLFSKLLDRGKQSGELTDEQFKNLEDLAVSIFSAHSTPAQPPPGVTPGPD